jgi:branched-chain amino acid transport system ATP-binding protein
MGLALILVEDVFRIIARLKSEGVTMLLVEQFAAAAMDAAPLTHLRYRGAGVQKRSMRMQANEE